MVWIFSAIGILKMWYYLFFFKFLVQRLAVQRWRAGAHCVALAGLGLTWSSGPCHPSADLQLSAVIQLRSHLDAVWTIDVNFILSNIMYRFYLGKEANGYVQFVIFNMDSICMDLTVLPNCPPSHPRVQPAYCINTPCVPSGPSHLRQMSLETLSHTHSSVSTWPF